MGYEAALGCAGEECEGRTLRVEKCKAATEVRRKEREGRLITKPAAGTTPSNGGPDGTDGAGGTEGTTASGPGRVAGYNVAYVGNIAFEVTAEEVLRFFAAGGAVPTKVSS